MKRELIHSIYILFFIFFSNSFFGQKLTLKLSSKKEAEKIILENIDYQKKHHDITSINLETERVSEFLKKMGYFANTFDSIYINDKKHTAYFSLNSKIDFVFIKADTLSESIFKELEVKNGFFSIPVKELETTLLNITEDFDQKGKSFSKVRLKNISIIEKNLFADLEIHQSKERAINKVIIKGYDNFPKKYLKNHFNIKSNTVFNQKKITEISKASKNLNFVSEIKTPEVLFTKDSTLLYIYLKKQQNNSFDGIVNFTSKENGGILFNGNINLELNNILNTGESFNLYWNSIGNERQEFKIATEIPYILGSKITPQLTFSIYKQDSTFLNTNFDSKLFYNINSEIKLALTYNSESSENLKKVTNTNIKTFTNSFFGFDFKYKISKNDDFLNEKLLIEINPALGKRKTDSNTTNQFKIKASTSYLWDISRRSHIFIKNETGFLNSDTYLDNELFRIGGANSIRGFNEQSIFTKKYTYFNLEYRFLTSKKSYFYTITNVGNVKTMLNNENLLSLGLGYLFFSKNSQINLSTAIGKSTSYNFDLKNSKLIISWKNYF